MHRYECRWCHQIIESECEADELALRRDGRGYRLVLCPTCGTDVWYLLRRTISAGKPGPLDVEWEDENLPIV